MSSQPITTGEHALFFDKTKFRKPEMTSEVVIDVQQKEISIALLEDKI